MTRYLLDSNIISDLLRHPRGPAAARIDKLDDQDILTSIIVAAELKYGAAKKGSARLTTEIGALLARMEVAAFEAPADRIYGDLRAGLQRSGRLIGANDLFIAAHALALDCVLVTDNTKEFSRVPDLKSENWLR